MEFVKSLFSHILAFIFFFALLFLSGTFFARELVTHDNICKALDESDVIRESMKNNGELIPVTIPEEIIDYIDIDDIIYPYIADIILYELKLIDEVPTINLIELNERIVSGIDKYVDEKLNDYTGGLGAYFDLTEIKEQILEYLEKNTSLDLSNAQILNEDDLQKIYDYAKQNIDEISQSTYLFEISTLVFSKEAQIIAIVVTIISFVLIILINRNIATAIAYTIAPFTINTIIYFIGYLITKNITFDGRLSANIINAFMTKAGEITLKYFIIFLIVTILMIILYLLSKKFNIFMKQKKGIATLDTIFDDYNREEVVKEMQEENKEE